MARKRMIDPEFWSDEEIGLWSFEARLFYIALWNFADDSGRLKAHNALLKAQIFPYDDGVDIKKLKEELKSKVLWYEVESSQYGLVRNFLVYQKIDHPSVSKLPVPPRCGFGEDASNLQESLDPKLIEDKLIEEKGEEGGSLGTEAFYEAWNAKMPWKVKRTGSRDQSLGVRRKDKDFEKYFDVLLDKILASDFLMGKKPSKGHANFKATFDWIIKNDTNYVKVLEGRYDNNGENI